MKTYHSNQTRFLALLAVVMMLNGTLALAQRTERSQSNTGRQVSPREHQQPQRPAKLEAQEKTKMPAASDRTKIQRQAERKEGVRNDFTFQTRQNRPATNHPESKAQRQAERKEGKRNDFTLQTRRNRPATNHTEDRVSERRQGTEKERGQLKTENRSRTFDRTSRESKHRSDRFDSRKEAHKDFSMRHNRYNDDRTRHHRSRNSDYYRRDYNGFHHQYGYNYYEDYYWQRNIPYWAPNYGYYSYTRHIYLPDYNCYYDLYRGYYMFFDGFSWYYSIDLPWFLANVDWRYVRQVELDDWYDDPFYYNDDDVIVYTGKSCHWDFKHSGYAVNHYHGSRQPVNGYFRIEVNL